ncbi:MAG: ComEC/Rec2 family competence protein [Planctomycetota bacterium]|nr:ComEC/Rec2 family competence protein [Planctomycetota bacterium]
MDAQQISASRQLLENRQKNRNKPCLLILLSVSVGIVIDRFQPVPFQASFTIAGGTLFLWLLSRSLHRGLRSGLLVIAACFVGANWHHQYWNHYPAEETGRRVDEIARPVALRGVVLQQPDEIPAPAPNPLNRSQSGTRFRFLFRIRQIRSGIHWEPASGRTRVTVEASQLELQAGDEIQLWGLISRTGRRRSALDFDPQSYYRSRRLLARVFVDQANGIRKTGRRAGGFWVRRQLDRARTRCRTAIERNVPRRSAPLIRAMMLGDRQQVSDTTRQKFLVTGTMHLLAISGLHVGILSLGFFFLMRIGVLPKKSGLLLTMGFVFFYCLLVGARPPVTRATILVILYCLARWLDRNPMSVNSLSLAGLTVLVSNPCALFETGVQLSFIAVATLIMIGEQLQACAAPADPLQSFLLRKRDRSERIRDAMQHFLTGLFLSSLGIWATTIPLVTEKFHVVAAVGILANVVLMLPVTLVLYAGLLVLLFDPLGLAGPWGRAADYLVQVILEVIDISASVPCGHWWAHGLGPLGIAVFYGLFAIFFLFARFHLEFRWHLLLFLSWLAVALWLTEYQSQNDRQSLEVTFIDVDHGTSTLVRFPDGQRVLYDAGSLNSSRLALDRISAILWEKKIYRLDAVILSHADLDHYNALPELMNRFSIQRVLVSPRMFEQDRSDSLEVLTERLRADGVPLLAIQAGANIAFGESCQTQILHPAGKFSGSTDNANSIVWLLQYRGRRVLLTGDLEKDGLSELVSHPALSCDILMAPHHGSGSADHASMADWCSPEIVVISCSLRKRPSRVVSTYRQAGAREVLLTAESGSITFSISAGGIVARPFHPPQH